MTPLPREEARGEGAESPRAPLPRLLVITDWTLPRERLLRALENVCALGPRVAVQHRAPDMATRRFLEEARALRALTAPHGVPLFVNGRLDVALVVGAHLHLPGAGLTVEDARAHLPAGRWLSVAVHTPDEAEAARSADLALVSPVFSPGSKPGDVRPTLGPDGLRALAARLPCPAYALGGVTPERAGMLRGAAAGLAAIHGILAAPRPAEAAERMLAALG